MKRGRPPKLRSHVAIEPAPDGRLRFVTRSGPPPSRKVGRPAKQAATFLRLLVDREQAERALLLGEMRHVTHAAVDTLRQALPLGRALQLARTRERRELLAAAVYWLRQEHHVSVDAAIARVAHEGIAIGSRRIVSSASSIRRAWSEHGRREFLANFRFEAPEKLRTLR